MKIEVIATTRTLQGTGASRRLRRANKVPGIVYGSGNAATMIELDHNPIYHALRKEAFHASILDLSIDGKSEQVLLRALQMHPYKQQVQHVDFLRIDPNTAIVMKVPLHFSNADLSPAFKQSAAIISHVMNDIQISCLPKDLPEFIAVDLKDFTVQHPLHVNDLTFPAGVKPVLVGRENPVVVVGKVPGAEEVAADAPAAAAEVPATAQKKPAADAAAPAGKDGKAPAKAPAAKKK